MSRFAEASARAGRAVPDNSPVDWTKERKTAESLLNGIGSEQATPSRPTPAPSLPLDSIEQTAPSHPLDSIGDAFQWPPKFDLDDVDLSRDAHARNFRRRSSRTQAPQDERRVELDDERPPYDSAWRHESVASSAPPVVRAMAVSREKRRRRLDVAHTVRSLMRKLVASRGGGWWSR